MIDAQGWFDQVTRIVSPNYDDRPDPNDISLLVLHHISLPPGVFGGGQVLELFSNNLDCASHPFFSALKNVRVSAHFFIDRAGFLIQLVPCCKRAWHAGQSSFLGRERCNDFSLGIELEGTGEIPYTVSQYHTLAWLTQQLIENYPIQAIVGHSDIAPARKTDPGPSFDWQRYYDLTQLSHSMRTHI